MLSLTPLVQVKLSTDISSDLVWLGRGAKADALEHSLFSVERVLVAVKRSSSPHPQSFGLLRKHGEGLESVVVTRVVFKRIWQNHVCGRRV